MTNTETRQFLSQFSEEQLEIAFTKLGYTLDSPEFPESIVEDVEAILSSIDEAVAQQKQLQGTQGAATEQAEAPKSESLVVQETVAIAAEILDVRNISVDQTVLFAVAQSIVRQTKAQATAINDLRRKTFVAELRKGQQELADDLLNAVKAGQDSTAGLFSEENIQKMVDQAVPAYESRINVDEFIAEIALETKGSAATEKERIRVGNEARANKVEFDLDGFLNEIYGE
jgi:phosphopantetheine adenylyltransferase